MPNSGGVLSTIGIATPANGSFTTQITVPTYYTPGSIQQVRATDSYGNVSLVQNFTVGQQRITVSPTSAAITSEVTITGVGFQPYTGVTTITIGSAQVLGLSTVVTDSVGAFTAKVTVPGVAVGGQAVVATVSGAIGSTSLTVLAAPGATEVPVATAFASIASSLVPNYVVWSFDNQTKNWLSYDSTPGAPARGLTGLSSGTIFWVQAASNCILTYGSTTYTLYAGWNNLVFVL